jgi:hypothetical protein
VDWAAKFLPGVRQKACVGLIIDKGENLVNLKLVIIEAYLVQPKDRLDLKRLSRKFLFLLGRVASVPCAEIRW